MKNNAIPYYKIYLTIIISLLSLNFSRAYSQYIAHSTDGYRYYAISMNKTADSVSLTLKNFQTISLPNSSLSQIEKAKLEIELKSGEILENKTLAYNKGVASIVSQGDTTGLDTASIQRISVIGNQASEPIFSGGACLTMNACIGGFIRYVGKSMGTTTSVGYFETAMGKNPIICFEQGFLYNITRYKYADINLYFGAGYAGELKYPRPFTAAGFNIRAGFVYLTVAAITSGYNKSDISGITIGFGF